MPPIQSIRRSRCNWSSRSNRQTTAHSESLLHKEDVVPTRLLMSSRLHCHQKDSRMFCECCYSPEPGPADSGDCGSRLLTRRCGLEKRAPQPQSLFSRVEVLAARRWGRASASTAIKGAAPVSGVCCSFSDISAAIMSESQPHYRSWYADRSRLQIPSVACDISDAQT